MQTVTDCHICTENIPHENNSTLKNGYRVEKLLEIIVFTFRLIEFSDKFDQFDQLEQRIPNFFSVSVIFILLRDPLIFYRIGNIKQV